MDIPTYEIYAIKFAGPLIRPGAMVHWFQDMDKNVHVNYYIFALRGGGKTILVDAGMDPQLGKERNLTGFVNPAEALKRIDIDAEKVKHVVITHIHVDHIGGIKLFPRATIYLQEKEFNFWIKNPIA
jgi:glyoxylase-like metal-dependent hydrolase (beta-lactamase superfamily II)